MSNVIDELKAIIIQYVPDGFRDEDGVWWEGPHRRNALNALDLVDNVAKTSEEAVKYIIWRDDGSNDAYVALSKALAALDLE